MSKSKERKKAERYWQDKIRNMGTAPELIINNQKTGERETFKQLKFFIDEEGKENINEIAKELRVTASTVILTAFGEVINKWSKNSKFSINMTMLSRDKTIPGVDKVVGDFTDVNVYSMDYSSCKSFESRILENQVSLWEDLQNNAVSGIEVLRELGREKKENVMIPIVYTSTLGVSDSDNSFLSRSNISYKISQTPQVWIDCQIAEENGGVAVNWDYRTGVFLQNVIRDMFEAFERVLKRLGKKDNTVLKETDPIGLPEKTQAVRNKVKEYFKDKEMTDQKFIFLPRIGERIYKTGDVGQYDEAGIIEFLGRSDNQVKVRGHRIELTEIDSILSENKELDDVVSIIVGDAQEDRRIVTVAVPKQAEVATEDTSQEIANIKNKEEELTKEVNKELLSEWVHAANKVVLSDIFLALYGKGVFTDSNRLYTYEEIVKTLNIPNKLYKLMHRWLTVLCNEKIVVHRDGGYCVNLFIAEQYKNNKKLWDEMYSIEGRLHYSQKLLDYLKTSSDVLPELMAGKEDPLNLLFPKGEMDVAMAAYHDNIINRIMNGLAKEEIEFLALDNRRTPIRILEVGAGVGGTSVDVIPSLDGTGAEYYFTDLSAFFLNNAREKFSGYEWVKYNIFDINKDIMEQTIAPFSVDIILAANVLHNAKNIHYVLENLKKLLKPNGTIIILEETLEAYTLLTSMEFKDGLTGFTDERAENNQTFFKREQWEGVFKEHKADIVYQFPEKGTPLEMAGQTIYVVRFKENYICPDKNNMLDELERRIPEYMIPSVITFLPRLPQTSNDKIDRGRISKWISASAEENKKVDVAELPQNDLEEQIARIWCKELNIERIGRNDNFYLSGGDSLLIAQVIARMRETIEAAKRWSWDDLLKEMMKTPTIRGVAKILSNQAGENEQDKSLVIIKEAAESSEKKVTVVFHAGTGTLTPYNSLIAYITERSQENEAVMGFTFGDEAEYLAIPTDKIFENLGKKYGRILSELGFTEYTLIGHCVGGLIALETAHYLKDKGKNVSSVTLLSTSIPHKKEETVLADLDMKIFETAVQTSLYNELLLERTFASLIDADIKKAGHQVDNDTLQQVIEYLIFNNGGNITVQALCSLTGKFAEVGAEFQRLHSMSATERMNDLYTTIERPNGQLMEHQRKMLNVLFRVFAQNFRCVSSYIPKVYTGKMRVFDCESAIANFFPSLFSEDKKTWEQYAQGEFLFDTMKGDHISCMNSPYIEENVKKILDL